MCDTTSMPENGWEMLGNYDVIYVDACTWMAPEIGEFLSNAAPILRQSGHKLTIIPSVRKELENCAPLKLVAQTALTYIEQYADVIDVQEGEEAPGTADRQFLRLLYLNKYKFRQLLITHDQQLAVDAENICPPEEGDASLVMTLWPGGELCTFAEMARRKEAQARARLAEMVSAAPLYMDATALFNPNVERFLQNISEPMASLGRWVNVVRASLPKEENAELQQLLDSYSELLHVIETDPRMPETDALLGELYLSDDNMEVDRVILVTDDALRANELRNRRPKCDRFPFVDFMTINKYGFLSFLKLVDSAPGNANGASSKFARPRYSQNYFGDWNNGDKKNSSYVPQLIGAIKSEDIEAMCEYMDKGANLRNGIITSLCQGKNNCLRVLIDRTDDMDVSCFQWWVVNFYDFANSYYLDENDEHYELLIALMEKCANLSECRDAMVHLSRMVSRTEAAHERLWNVIRLAVSKQAPVSVYSPETGEGFAEIASRQGNQDMVDFFASL